METTLVKKNNNQKIAEQVKLYSTEEVAIIKATVAKGFNDLELSYFLNVAKRYDLDPFTKQIWGYKDTRGNIIVFAGRDGFLAKAQGDPRWNGILSDAVREDEKFEMNVAEGRVTHQKNITSKAKIIGAYAISKPKGCQYPTIEWADFDTYNKGYNVWKADPVAMIKKVAESHCLAKAYGISGLAVEEDFDTSTGTAYVIDHEDEPSTKSLGYAEELIRTSNYDEDMKCIIENKLKHEMTNSELEEIINDLRENQPKEY